MRENEDIEAIFNENKTKNVLQLYLLQTFNIISDLFPEKMIVKVRFL